MPALLILTVLFTWRTDLRKAAGHSLVVLGLFLLVIAPWSIRNFVQFGSFALNIQSASVPFGYLVPSVIALEERRSFDQAQKDLYAREGGIESVEEITFANAAHYKERTKQLLLEHPLGLIEMSTVTFLTFFTHDGYLDVLGRLDLSPEFSLGGSALKLLFSPMQATRTAFSLIQTPAALIVLGKLLWLVVFVFFLVGTISYLRVKEQRERGAFIVLIILYFTLTTLAVGLAVNARFRMPVNALIVPFAMYGGVRAYLSAKRLTGSKAHN